MKKSIPEKCNKHYLTWDEFLILWVIQGFLSMAWLVWLYLKWYT